MKLGKNNVEKGRIEVRPLSTIAPPMFADLSLHCKIYPDVKKYVTKKKVNRKKKIRKKDVFSSSNNAPINLY